MQEYVKMVKNTFNYSGRTRRREYWVASLLNASLTQFFYGLMFLAATLAGDCLYYRTGASFGYSTVGSVAGTVLCIPYILSALYVLVTGLSLTVRRFHDSGKPGWLVALCWIGTCCCGIGAIVQLVFCCLDSQPEANQWGENPKTLPENQYENNTSIIIAIVLFVLISILSGACTVANLMLDPSLLGI